MTHQKFGGQWTDKKLKCLSDYLHGYMTIMKGNPRARFFKTNYVDAFAGTGYIEVNNEENEAFLPGFENDENREDLKKGSPCLALETEPPFDKYIFIEKNSSNIAELCRLEKEFPDRDIEVINSDANDYLTKWCGNTDWVKNRAVVFLDPFGMQVEWSLLEEIAATEAIDLWLLVPLGVGLVRMLTKDRLPSSDWGLKISSFLGTDDWKTTLYKTSSTPTLFGEEIRTTRDTDLMKIGEYVLGRLNTIFYQVAPNALVLRNSRNNPIYLLTFAAGNEKGSKPALRIANHLIKKLSD